MLIIWRTPLLSILSYHIKNLVCAGYRTPPTDSCAENMKMLMQSQSHILQPGGELFDISCIKLPFGYRKAWATLEYSQLHPAQPRHEGLAAKVPSMHARLFGMTGRDLTPMRRPRSPARPALSIASQPT